MTCAILGLGTALPATTFDQKEGLHLARALCCRTPENETWLPLMYQGTGIEKRSTVLPRAVIDDVIHGTRSSGSVFLPTGQPDDRGPTTEQRMHVYRSEAPPLARRACRDAISQSRIAIAELTHLITVSCTGFEAPGIDADLIRDLKLSPSIQRTHVGYMGCHGALNGLRVARAYTAADPKARVLLCAVELCSLHYCYGWDPGRVIANAIFADGAAAVVLGPSHDSDGWRVAASGSHVFPDTADAMTWSIGDHGFVMSLSKKAPSLIAKHLRPWLTDWLQSQELSIDGIGSWAIHPGGPRIIDAVQESLGLQPEQTAIARQVFAERGNMSSPTVLFIIDAMRRNRTARPCLALGFGPGLAVEAALLR